MKHWKFFSIQKGTGNYSDTNTFLVVFMRNLYPNMGLEVHKLWVLLFFRLIPTIKYYCS